MVVFFTLCSCNYIAQAKTLGDSLLLNNPHASFVIGLVDRLDGKMSEDQWGGYELIEVENIGIPNFHAMCEKYNIVELNTSVKPYYMDYFYNRNKETTSVVYLDPDIMVFGSFEHLERKLSLYNIVLTPHSVAVSELNQAIKYELAMLKTGVFNLGFIATSRSDETQKFLLWWQRRMQEFCYYRPNDGLFVDQLWANLIPVYYDKVYIESNPGYNMCYWNHFERELNLLKGTYYVNNNHELIFYHFSSYDPMVPSRISNRAIYHPLSERPDLEPLFSIYRDRLLANDYVNIKKVKPHYASLYRSEGISYKIYRYIKKNMSAIMNNHTK